MHRSLEDLQNDIHNTLAGLDGADMDAKPASGKWGAGEILEHLLLTYEGSARALDRCVDSQKVSITPRTLRQRIAAWALLTTGYFPPGRKSPERALPKGRSTPEVVALLGPRLTELDRAIARCEQMFGNRKVLDHPALGALSAPEWRRFHCVHGKHHLKQIAALRAKR